MATLQEIKLRINSVGQIKKIANALEVVSMTRLRKIEEKTEKARRYFDSIRRIAFDICKNLLYEAHPFFRPRKEIKKRLVIVVTSDKGLCGDFNASIERELKVFLSEKPGLETIALSVGRKGKNFLKKQGIAIKNY